MAGWIEYQMPPASGVAIVPALMWTTFCSHTTDQATLRHRIDLRAVEAANKARELIRGDEEAVSVRADQRLIAEAWAVRIARRAVQAVIGGVDGVEEP